MALKGAGIMGIVLTGTPGIGKTCFLYYVLWLLAVMMREGKQGAPPCVVFELQDADMSEARLLFRVVKPVLVGAWNDFEEQVEDTSSWCVSLRILLT